MTPKLQEVSAPKPGEGMTSEFCADETWGWTHMNLPTQVIMVCLKSQKMGTKLSCIDLVNVCERNNHIFTKVEASHAKSAEFLLELLESVLVERSLQQKEYLQKFPESSALRA